MKKLQCELCGSVEIIKTSQNDFQCQHCGCKYTLEQVRTIISGEVTIRQPDFQIIGGKLIRYSGESTEVFVPDSISVIGESAFQDCSAIKSVVLPNSITMIEKQAFFNCMQLSSINLPDSLVSIGDNAFSECKSLCNISFPQSLSFIGDYAFHKCYMLNEITLSSGLSDIGEGVFSSCATLKKVNFCGEISEIPKYAFRNTGIEEIMIPEGVLFIEEGAFEWCDELKTIGLPSSLMLLDPLSFGRSLEKNNRSYVTKSLFPCRQLVNVLGNREIFFQNIKLLDIPAVSNNLRAIRRQQGVCEYCGGQYTGVFRKKCSLCGRLKE